MKNYFLIILASIGISAIIANIISINIGYILFPTIGTMWLLFSQNYK